MIVSLIILFYSLYIYPTNVGEFHYLALLFGIVAIFIINITKSKNINVILFLLYFAPLLISISYKGLNNFYFLLYGSSFLLSILSLSFINKFKLENNSKWNLTNPAELFLFFISSLIAIIISFNFFYQGLTTDIYLIYGIREKFISFISNYTLLAYLSSWIATLLIFITSFYFGYAKKQLYGFYALLILFYSIFIIGVKYPVFLSFISFFLGLTISNKNSNFYYFLFSIALLLLEIISWYLDFSFIGRLTHSKSVHIDSYYQFYISPYLFEEFTNSDMSLSYFIGEKFSVKEFSNANTMFLVDSLSRYGISIYLLIVSAFILLFLFLNTIAKPLSITIFFCYSLIILSEQALRTSMFSSGLILMLFFIIVFNLFSYKAEYKKK